MRANVDKYQLADCLVVTLKPDRRCQDADYDCSSPRKLIDLLTSILRILISISHGNVDDLFI